MTAFRYIDGAYASGSMVHCRRDIAEDGLMIAVLLKRFRSKYGLPVNFAVKI